MRRNWLQNLKKSQGRSEKVIVFTTSLDFDLKSGGLSRFLGFIEYFLYKLVLKEKATCHHTATHLSSYYCSTPVPQNTGLVLFSPSIKLFFSVSWLRENTSPLS